MIFFRFQFGTWHYGTNGPPYNGFGRIARWQCDKVTFLQSSVTRYSNLSLVIFCKTDFSEIYIEPIFLIHSLHFFVTQLVFVITAHCGLEYNSENANKLGIKKKRKLFTYELQVPERLPSGDIEAIFSLCDSDYTFSMWQVPLFLQLLGLQSTLHYSH